MYAAVPSRALALSRSRTQGQPRRSVDASRARKEFGFEAKVDLRDGLRRTIEWFEANREVSEARRH
mgnify:CR=1 FL=1